jgi:hypothetical protein
MPSRSALVASFMLLALPSLALANPSVSVSASL